MGSLFQTFFSRFRSLARNYPYLPSLILLSLGLVVFGSSTYYNLIFKNQAGTEVSQSDNPVSDDSKGVQEGEIAGAETGPSSPTPTKKPVINTTNNKSTPTPTQTPSEIKEIHTKETVEEKTVVVVTATPTPSPIPTVTATPSPTPTPDITPFQATIAKEASNRDGTNYLKATVAANKTIKSCNYSIGMISGSANPNGNVCTAEVGQTPSSPTFHSMEVTSELGETITF